ncbi:hypothetical protein MTO96_002317 [Rhipicephalus appendiculatus]
MDSLAYATGSVCFVFLLDMANADDDVLKKLRKKYAAPFPLPAIIILTFMIVMFVTSCIVFWTIWYRRRQRALAMLQPTPCVPPSLSPAPAPGPVVSGVPTYMQPEAHPLIPGASTSLTTLNTHQKDFQEDRSPPYSKNGFYYDHSSTSTPQLPTAPIPPAPSAPPQPPPPYGS